MSVLRIERRDRVAVLTFDDPDRRNVVSDEMNDELLAAFDTLEADSEVGAVVLTGEGRAFCAG
ncbi:MAG: enoyl-CoA hydratase/isomerase family protein, partial [Actinomycetota bacterium]|nr:enoyl-CoA hydratase/isomerase family protein [Actinomycetota bacterium]MEC9425715.1 enoyl-CoA hydratase/isomerase family protein [Actinomycetota bacterium]